MILYQYAKNNHNKLIHIEKINNNNKTESYNCVTCNNPIRPRAINSKKVVPHFYHPNQNNQPKCNPESYLHKLAKSLFLEHFQSKKPLTLRWLEKQICDNPFSEKPCTKKVGKEINLITQYPHFNLEKKDTNGYIPDLLLNNDKNEKLYIEFAYSHFSTKEKRECGEKIVEITIKNEQDIENILKNGIIKNGKDIEFINFNEGIFQCQGKCNTPQKKPKIFLPNKELPKKEKPRFDINTPKETKKGSLFVPLKCYTCNKIHYGKIATIQVHIMDNKYIIFDKLLSPRETLHEDASFSITKRERIFGKEKNYYEHFCPNCNKSIGKRKEPPIHYRKGKELNDDEKWLEQIT